MNAETMDKKMNGTMDKKMNGTMDGTVRTAERLYLEDEEE